jgi:hypothetical protein
MNGGWFCAARGEAPMELLKRNQNAFILAWVIAFRARWTSGYNQYDLATGEACIGDYRDYGMTEQEYRTAKRILQEAGFATFRPTSRGTIAKLLDTRLFFNLSEGANDPNNEQVTDSQRTGNEQLTTNNKVITKEGNTDVGQTGARREPRQRPLPDGEWLDGLKANPAFAGIDVQREHAKMVEWGEVNHKQPTRRRFINWLNRCDRPLTAPANSQPDHSKGF